MISWPYIITKPVFLIKTSLSNKPSKLEKALDTGSTILLLLMWAVTVIALLRMPATIPTHYNSNGQVDAYGNKTTILALPILATVIYFVISFLVKRPLFMKKETDIPERDSRRQMSLSTKMLRFVKLTTILILTEITVSTYLISTGFMDGLGSWSLPLELAIIFIPIIVISIQMWQRRGGRN